MNLNQGTVPVSNVENSIEFYEKLGLKVIVKALPDYARLECPFKGPKKKATSGFILKFRIWTGMFSSFSTRAKTGFGGNQDSKTWTTIKSFFISPQ
jgi:hypothetical protein